jgi:hypothetical protein
MSPHTFEAGAIEIEGASGSLKKRQIIDTGSPDTLVGRLPAWVSPIYPPHTIRVFGDAPIKVDQLGVKVSEERILRPQVKINGPPANKRLNEPAANLFGDRKMFTQECEHPPFATRVPQECCKFVQRNSSRDTGPKRDFEGEGSSSIHPL